MGLNPALDCRHYRGDRPCEYSQRCRCVHYEPMGLRILIIKLGALGDVVRTTCLLPTLKRLYPESHITWITDCSAISLLRHDPSIDVVLGFDSAGILSVREQEFDIVLSLDKEPAPAGLCNSIKASDKRGMGLSRWGTVYPCNRECEDYFALGLDNELKFHHNTLSYPALIHKAVGLEYLREPYRIYCDPDSLSRAESQFSAWGSVSGRKFAGLNTGSGTVFANKSPSPTWWKTLAERLGLSGFTPVLLGGPDEREQNAWIVEQSSEFVLDGGSDNSPEQFAAIVSQCDLLISGDTLALHIAVARDIPVIALFGPTAAQEIDLFDNGLKIISPAGCGPCYKRTCDVKPSCMDQISIDDVFSAVASSEMVT